MLPFRLGIVTAVAALCMWGLFSLLDSLQKPGLLRSAKAVVIKGCDPIESDEARAQCPVLYCQKALLDARLVPLRTEFQVSVDRLEDSERWIAGRANGPNSGDAGVYFFCHLAGMKVTSATLIDHAQLQDLSASGN